jgi:Na+-transporting NADH:ubiquinone oxidoreductase subunit A
MAVREGDVVTRGGLLFTDKKNPVVRFTSPGSGTVTSISRGDTRRFVSVTVNLDGRDAHETFPTAARDRDSVRAALVASGLWAALRARPFGKIPDPAAVPAGIFITAIDTEPLAPDPAPLIAAAADDFLRGQAALAKLTDGLVYVCHREGAQVPAEKSVSVRAEAFAGPHPAGLPGTHIHFLLPASPKRPVWHIGYQDVIAAGRLFASGQLEPVRTIALTGPCMLRPHLVRAPFGASVEDLLHNQLDAREGPVRAISGSVLIGRTATGPEAYLGRYHRQVTALPTESRREFLAWLRPGFGKFSAKPTFAGSVLGGGRGQRFTTSTNGSPRAMVPVGMYEKVMPLDILPTFLLRALASEDDDGAAALGALELAEDDLALCSFVCPGKEDWGRLLRAALDRIEREG